MAKRRLGLERPFVDKPKLPNSYSIEIGQKIREARLEQGLTQEKLAEMVYKRRASLSDMENGKMFPDAFTLILIANRLGKSLDYFVPGMYRTAIEYLDTDLSALEKDLIAQFRRVPDHDWQTLIIQNVKASADFETSRMQDSSL